MTTKTESAEAVIVERTLNAPIARVWRALTDVDQMREWYFDLKEFKPQVGFEFDFVVDHEANRYHHLCKVTEVVPEKRSLTPGDTKANRAIRWSRLNCFLKVT